MNKYTLDYIRDNNLILFEAVVGSQAYGTSTPDSDEDRKGVFILKEEDLYGLNYVPQVNDTKNDIVFYEIRRFFELIQTGNPTLLELMNIPDRCVVKKHPLFDLILKEKNKFITKSCKNAFAGYAIQSIKKSKGQNKKQNWEKNKIERKTPIDFCYVVDKNKSYPLKKLLENDNMNQLFCGLVKIPNARDLYALYYDIKADMCFNLKRFGEETCKKNIEKFKSKKETVGLGYSGIEKENANDIRLSSVPKDQNLIAIISYNKDGYTTHCKDYKEYQVWLKNRNEKRWIDVKGHGQKIDGKNMLHCKRLLEVAREIAEGKGINVERENANELLKIRKGEVCLEELIEWAENEIATIDDLFDKSDLPNEVDPLFVHELLLKIRKEFYNKIE